MTKRIVGFALLAALGASAAVAAGPPPPQATVSISLPGDLGFAFKPGPGADVTQAACLTCHSSAYVVMQPAMNKAQWTVEVQKMRAVYGAQFPADQVDTIATYLATEYGKP